MQTTLEIYMYKFKYFMTDNIPIILLGITMGLFGLFYICNRKRIKRFLNFITFGKFKYFKRSALKYRIAMNEFNKLLIERDPTNIYKIREKYFFLRNIFLFFSIYNIFITVRIIISQATILKDNNLKINEGSLILLSYHKEIIDLFNIFYYVNIIFFIVYFSYIFILIDILSYKEGLLLKRVIARVRKIFIFLSKNLGNKLPKIIQENGKIISDTLLNMEDSNTIKEIEYVKKENFLKKELQTEFFFKYLRRRIDYLLFYGFILSTYTLSLFISYGVFSPRIDFIVINDQVFEHIRRNLFLLVYFFGSIVLFFFRLSYIKKPQNLEDVIEECDELTKELKELN